MTAIIFEALRKTGQRGIVQKGWGGLGEGIPAPPYVYIVGNCPHDWLFPQCSAVVHHGGAGTTAAGLLSEVSLGKPSGFCGLGCNAGARGMLFRTGLSFASQGVLCCESKDSLGSLGVKCKIPKCSQLHQILPSRSQHLQFPVP